MAFLDSVNRYIAYRLKEMELRLHTWKRAKEISRAYDTTRNLGKDEDAAPTAPWAVKGVKIVAMGAVAGAIVFGVIKIIPMIPAPAPKAAAAEEEFTEAARQPVEIPEDAELPEAAVMPEGYAEMAVHAAQIDSSAAAEPEAEAPPPLPLTGDALADIFKNGMPRGIADRVLLGDKAAKVLYIFKSTPNGWDIEKAYPIAIGEKEGRKQVEGDKRTPEGVYHIVGRKHRSELTNLYGPAAFITDYPNEEDRRERRTGHGIWIHGSERGNIPPLFTQGCLAVSNPDILEIAGVLKPWIGLPVIIVSGTEGRKHLTSIDFNKLKARGGEVIANYNGNQAEFEKLVMNWKNAWESKNIEAYSTFYSTSSFMDGTKKWDAFREHKSRTFGMYSVINIDLSNIVLTELTENLATVKFYQVYTAGTNRFDNAKRLIFRKEQGNWKIHREISFSKEELLL